MARVEIAAKDLFATPAGGMCAPTLKFAAEDGTSAGSAGTIRPNPGLLLLLPTWLHHQVRRYRGTGWRILAAFNLGHAAREA